MDQVRAGCVGEGVARGIAGGIGDGGHPRDCVSDRVDDSGHAGDRVSGGIVGDRQVGDRVAGGIGGGGHPGDRVARGRGGRREGGGGRLGEVGGGPAAVGLAGLLHEVVVERRGVLASHHDAVLVRGRGRDVAALVGPQVVRPDVALDGDAALAERDGRVAVPLRVELAQGDGVAVRDGVEQDAQADGIDLAQRQIHLDPRRRTLDDAPRDLGIDELLDPGADADLTVADEGGVRLRRVVPAHRRVVDGDAPAGELVEERRALRIARSAGDELDVACIQLRDLAPQGHAGLDLAAGVEGARPDDELGPVPGADGDHGGLDVVVGRSDAGLEDEGDVRVLAQLARELPQHGVALEVGLGAEQGGVFVAVVQRDRVTLGVGEQGGGEGDDLLVVRDPIARAQAAHVHGDGPVRGLDLRLQVREQGLGGSHPDLGDVGRVADLAPGIEDLARSLGPGLAGRHVEPRLGPPLADHGGVQVHLAHALRGAVVGEGSVDDARLDGRLERLGRDADQLRAALERDGHEPAAFLPDGPDPVLSGDVGLEAADV